MWLMTWAIIVAVNICLYLWYMVEKRKYKDIEKIPGPTPTFFFGNNLEFGDSIVESFECCQRMIKTYGPLVRIWQGPLRVNLFVTNPDHVEYFLSSNVHLKKSAGYQLFAKRLGQGLITSEGEIWKKHRRILTPAFHFKILEQFCGTFHTAGLILINNLKKKAGTSIEIHDYIVKYALDVICESSMRIHVNAQEKPDNEYIHKSETFMGIYIRRFFSVLRRSDFVFRLSPDYKEHQKCLDYLQNFTRKVIKQRKQERKEDVELELDEFGIKKKKVFLDILLDTNQLTDEEIREEVDTFLFAGHDTVSSAMSFGLFELAKHPNVQVKILEEIHEVVGTDNNTEITLKNLQDMRFLDCTMKEILRIYPPAPLFERELVEDVLLDGLRIPRGTTISFHPYTHHRNAKLFPDPEKFDPDRFLPHNTANRHPFAYIPFSAGARNCIGSKYALMNCKIAIANVVRNFEIQPVVPTHVPILGNDSVMKSINGLPIILRIRN